MDGCGWMYDDVSMDVLYVDDIYGEAFLQKVINHLPRLLL